MQIMSPLLIAMILLFSNKILRGEQTTGEEVGSPKCLVAKDCLPWQRSDFSAGF
jgi:hypothetical protein